MADSFKDFLVAETCLETLAAFRRICQEANVEYPPIKNESYDHCTFLERLSSSMKSTWKSKQFFDCLKIRYNRDEYFVGESKTERIAKDKSALVVGAGPCGLRSAIELTLLGAKTIVVEQREAFTRNNVLNLWAFNVHDLKTIGAKILYPKLGTGDINHIGIRRIQLLLLKIALIFGVEIHIKTLYSNMVPPSTDRKDDGWKAILEPAVPALTNFPLDIVLGANARRDTFPDFNHQCFRGKLAVGITANFLNRNSSAEANIRESGGLACYGRPGFFRELFQETEVFLENFVYYKDETHYFVMTANKESLLKRNILKENLRETKELLSKKNVAQEPLYKLMTEIVNFATDNNIPNLELCRNFRGEMDVALFDFTAMYNAKHSALFKESKGHKLMLGLVGDSLLEPFWPMGTGLARGFFGAFDHVWMIKQWCLRASEVENYKGQNIEVELLQKRESIYKVLPQLYERSIWQTHEKFRLDPHTRYRYLNFNAVTMSQVEHLYVKTN